MDRFSWKDIPMRNKMWDMDFDSSDSGQDSCYVLT